MIYDNLPTIRYMGSKGKLLQHIIPAIASVTPKNGVVCDIMAGSNAVSYALKRYYTVYTNDVQKYSYVISKALIENQNVTISSHSAKYYLENNYKNNIKEMNFDFFTKTYSDTYFSKNQCIDIDSIRYAIDKLKNECKKNLYLLSLMNTMCKVQSTPGHFAQFMPSDHKRIIPLQKISVWNEFLKNCDNYFDIIKTDKNNKAFCSDYKQLLNDNSLNDVDTIYLDAPYSQEQYSRFYHILETLVKYDSPSVNFKAKYRGDRFMSNFCYKSKVAEEFKNFLIFCNEKNKNLVISYSTNAVLSIPNLIEICKVYFKKIAVKEIDYSHSTQGKGSNRIKEILICLSN